MLVQTGYITTSSLVLLVNANTDWLLTMVFSLVLLVNADTDWLPT